MRRCTSTTTTVPSRSGRDSVMGGTLVGTLLVIGGLWLAYIAWSTPVLAAISAAITAAIRPDATASQPGMLMLALALAVPAAFVVVGTNRLARTAGALRGPGVAAAIDSRGSCRTTWSSSEA